MAKKAVEVLASNSKGRKFIGYTIGIVIFLLLLPLIVIFGLFGFMGNSDAFQLDKTQIMAALPVEGQAQIQQIDTACNSLASKFTDNGFSENDIEKAEFIYLGSFIGKEKDKNFYDNFIWCFKNATEKTSLYDNLGIKFSVKFTDKEKAYLDEKYGVTLKKATDNYIFLNPFTKNNIDLVVWAKVAQQEKWGYVYGTYGEVLDEKLLKSKIAQYPDEVAVSEDFIRKNWLGTHTADCVGLIKGYSWYNFEKKSIETASNNMPDIGANGMFEVATEKGTIDTIPEISGLAVWQNGHIGIYIGDGEVIEAMGTKYGVVKTKLSSRGWTHWLKIPYINYE